MTYLLSVYDVQEFIRTKYVRQVTSQEEEKVDEV